MPRGVVPRPDQIIRNSKGKEILPFLSEATKVPIMEREDIEDILVSKTADICLIAIDDSKDLADTFSLPNLAKPSYNPKEGNNEYSAIFSKGETDICSVANLDLDNFKISDHQQDLIVTGSRKRKALADISDEDCFSVNKRREILEAVNEGIFQISPGNWGDVGYGVITNESWLQFAFFPKSFTESSPFINSIKFKKRGTRFGSRRLTLIKNAACRKHCLEITRQAFENVAVIEMGIDPFGNKIDAIPIFEEFSDIPRVNSEGVVPVTTCWRGRQGVIEGFDFPLRINNDQSVCRMFMNDPCCYVFWFGFGFFKKVTLCDKAPFSGCLLSGEFKMESLMTRPTCVLVVGACLLSELSQVFRLNSTARECGVLCVGSFACWFCFYLVFSLGFSMHVSCGCCYVCCFFIFDAGLVVLLYVGLCSGLVLVSLLLCRLMIGDIAFHL
ncbi:hypothetical protein GQ457_16G025810 [Hibiscus cannabinus]